MVTDSEIAVVSLDPRKLCCLAWEGAEQYVGAVCGNADRTLLCGGDQRWSSLRPLAFSVWILRKNRNAFCWRLQALVSSARRL